MSLRNLCSTVTTSVIAIAFLFTLPVPSATLSQGLPKLEREQRFCFPAGTYQACGQLNDENGTHGCAQCGRDSVDTQLVNILSIADLSLLASQGSGVYSLLISTDFFQETDVQRAIRAVPSGLIGSVIVAAQPTNLSTAPPDSFSPESTYPNQAYSLYSDNYNWNRAGTGYLDYEYPFNVFQVSQADATWLNYSASRFAQGSTVISMSSNFASYPRFVVESNGETLGCNQTSAQCVDDRTCVPAGGQSIWSAFRKLDNTLPIAALGAPIDSRAFFRENATGAAAELASMAVMLTAMEGFARKAGNSSLTMAVRPVFFAFDAESLGFSGSRRFFHDVNTFNCTASAVIDTSRTNQNYGCDNPYVPFLRFQEFGNVSWDGFLDISNIGGAANDDGLFLHMRNNSYEGSSQLLRSIIQNFMPQNATSTELPPSLIQSVVRYDDSIPSFLMADFNEYFTNMYYHSQYDNVMSLADRVPVLCSLAGKLAETVYEVAFNTTVEGSLTANCSLITEFVNCFGQYTEEDRNCTLADEYFASLASEVDFNNQAEASNFAGQYTPAVLGFTKNNWAVKRDLIYSFMAFHSAIEVTNITCAAQEDCFNVTLEFSNFTSPRHIVPARCIKSLCVVSDTFFHDAYGPGFDLISPKAMIFNVSDQSLPAIAESLVVDDTPQICTRTDDGSTYEVGIFVSGLAVWLGSVVVAFLTRYFLHRSLTCESTSPAIGDQ